MPENATLLEIRNLMEQEAIEALDKLADCEDQLEVERLRHEEVMDNLIPQELKDEATRLRQLYAVKTEGLVAAVDGLKGGIQTIALALRHTVKGERRQAVYNNGRTSWDNRALTAYAKTHPEVADLKKQGDPYVSVRNVAKR